MGFYDGVKGTDRASAWAVADAADIPAVLVLHPKGASLTLAAQVRGLQTFRTPNHIAGLLLNNCKPSLYAHLKPILEEETGLPVAGYLPPMEEAVLDSRHLGLLTAREVEDLAARFGAIARQMERTVDVNVLLTLAGETVENRPRLSLRRPGVKSRWPGMRHSASATRTIWTFCGKTGRS